MILKHYYYTQKSALTNEQCNKIINLGKKYIEEYKKNNISINAITKGNAEKKINTEQLPLSDKVLSEITEKEKYYVRDSKCVFFTEQWVFDLIAPFIKEINNKAGWKYDIDYMEDPQFTIYEPGGFYNWHSDGGSDWNSVYVKKIPGLKNEDKSSTYTYTDYNNFLGKIRKLSVTINLNDSSEYEGGDLVFDLGPHNSPRFYTCNEIKNKGSIAVFPSFVHHQVKPILKGTRYSLVVWCLGKPFK
jgi:PKHD-type hydroxylase